MRRFRAIPTILFTSTLLASGPVSAETRIVDPEGGGDSTEIQAAIDAAGDGDVVLVRPGEYATAHPVTFLGRAITVRSEGGPEVTTIRTSGISTWEGRVA